MPLFTTTAAAAATGAVLSTETIMTLSIAGGTALGAAVYGAVDWMFFSSSSKNRVSSDIRRQIKKRLDAYEQNVTALKSKHHQADKSTQVEFQNTVKQLKAEKDKFACFLKAVFQTIPDAELAATTLLKLSEDHDEALQLVLKALQNQVEVLASENESLKASKIKLTTEVTSLEDNLSALNMTLTELKKSTDDERSSYEKLSSQLEEAQKNIKEFKTIIAEKDKQIEMLNRKNNTLQGFVVKLTYAQEEKTEDNHHHSQSTCQPGHSFF